MIKEALELLAGQAVLAATPRLVRLPEGVEPDHVYLLAKADGSVERHVAEPAPRDHKAGDLAAVCTIVNDFASDDPNGADLVVWYSRSGVTLLFEDATRRDRVKLPFLLHPQLCTLHSLEKKPTAFSQKDFIWLLRVQFAGCLGAAQGLLESVRSIRFLSVTDGTAKLAQGKASVGRKIESELAGADAFPDEVSLQVPVFEGPLSVRRFRVQCALEVDPAAESFKLVPMPGAIEQAVCEAEAWVGATLAEGIGTSARVYYGSPE